MPSTWKTTGEPTVVKKSIGKTKSMQGSVQSPCIFYKLKLNHTAKKSRITKTSLNGAISSHARFLVALKNKL